MADVITATAKLDKAAYNQHDAAVVTITGSDVVTTTKTTQLAVTVTVKNPLDGATGTASVTVPVSSSVADTESIVIDSVKDNAGNVWAVASGGLSASAKLDLVPAS